MSDPVSQVELEIVNGDAPLSDRALDAIADLLLAIDDVHGRRCICVRAV
ncbi:MAG: hypothetical protein IIA66_13240 [Planctomycetes bacterium]|nr:hypothetical protein [Planctomycetota bacterium]